MMTKLQAQSNLNFTEEQLISLIQQHPNDAYEAKFEFKVLTDVDKFKDALKQCDEKRLEISPEEQRQRQDQGFTRFDT